MSVYRIRRMIPPIAIIATTAVLAAAAGAQAAAPVKLTVARQFGDEVNVTEAGKGPELEDVCTVASKDKCRPGTAGSAPGDFQLAEGVAVAPSGDVYVVDKNNERVDEFNASGQFVLMFGWDVNKTKVEKGPATQQQMNVCTEAEIKAGGECQVGLEGGAPGQFGAPYSIGVDAGGDVYVAEFVFGGGGFGQRVQKLTPAGEFVFEIGREVNGTKKTNLCSHAEELKAEALCTAPGAYAPEVGSFNFEQECGNLLAVKKGTLYVGDENRVQEFAEASGASSGEAPLPVGERVGALAADEAGDLYLTYDTSGSSSDVVREFDASGNEAGHFEVHPEQPSAEVHIRGLALDSEGHLAVAAEEELNSHVTLFGTLYEANGHVRLTAFRIPATVVKGIGFGPNPERDLYIATGDNQEILQYVPKLVAALATLATTPESCTSAATREADVMLNCTLSGEVNPEGVPGTEASFEWGLGSEAACGLEFMTAKQLLAAPEKVQAALEGLRPHEAYCYRLNVEDENAKAPEALVAELSAFKTKLAAPRIVIAPQAQFVKASSAVMFSQLNPENAQTKYFFEYAPGAKALALCGRIVKECNEARLPCSGATQTPVSLSNAYGLVGASSEAVGLRPDTEYSYRLVAENGNESVAEAESCAAVGTEAGFTTTLAPSPSAATGSCSVTGSTSAVVYATVTPDGAPVTYSFELGVYEGAGGAATRFGVVSSGSVAPNGGPVEVALPLTGLQPGTEYAYRIAISSGYIDNEAHTLQGSSGKFVTGGLPAVLQLPVVLAQLPPPSIGFPKAVSKTKPKSKGKAKKKAKRGKAKKGKKKARRSTARRAR
jgi:hypothetical protein